MNAVALAICGAAWLGGIALIVPSGAVAVGWRRPRPSVPAAALGTLAALGAAPLLLLAGAAGGSASDSLLPAIVGLLAALVGAFAVGRRSDVAEARGIALVEPSASMLGALALVLASAAAGFAVGLALATGGGGLVGEGVAAGEPLAAAAGSALIAAAVPGIALGAGRRRRDALAVGVAGVTLVAAAVASVPPAVAAAGSVLAALALPTGASVAPTLLSRQGLVVVGAVACAIPLLVGVLGVALLLSEPNAIGGAPGRPRGDHVALVLLAVGGLGVALLAVAERGLHPRRSPLALLSVALGVPVAAFALWIGDPIPAAILAAAATVVAGALRSGDAEITTTDVAVPVGSAILAVGGLTVLSLPAVSVSSPEGVAGLAGLAVAGAVAVRLGAIPFHRPAIALADRASPAIGAVAIGWLPAVFAFVTVGGPGAVGPAVPPGLDDGAAAAVVLVAVATIVLGGVASLAHEHLTHALAYLVTAQTGWVVLTFAAPTGGAPALAAFLPAFAAGSLVLGGLGLVADRGTGIGRVADLGRSPLAGSVEVVALVGAALALIGLPGLGVWSARSALGHDAIGGGFAADALVGIGALVTAAAIGRLILAAGGPVVRSGWPGDGRPSAFAASWRLEAVSRGSAAGAVAVGMLALLAAAIGLGFVR